GEVAVGGVEVVVGVATVGGGAGPGLAQAGLQGRQIRDGELHFDFQHLRPLLGTSGARARYGNTNGVSPPKIMTARAFLFQSGFERAVMAEFQTVCRVGDLADGEGKTVAVGPKLIAVFR